MWPVQFLIHGKRNLNVAKLSRWTELMLRQDVATNTKQWNPSSFLEHKDSTETELYMFPYSKMKNGWVQNTIQWNDHYEVFETYNFLSHTSCGAYWEYHTSIKKLRVLRTGGIEIVGKATSHEIVWKRVISSTLSHVE